MQLLTRKNIRVLELTVQKVARQNTERMLKIILSKPVIMFKRKSTGFITSSRPENPYDLTLTIDRMTKTLEKARQKPYEKTNDSLPTNERDGCKPDTATAERNDKGDDRCSAKGRKRPQFLLL